MVRRLLVLGLGAVVQVGCLLSNPPDHDEPTSFTPVVEQTSPMARLYAINRDDPSRLTTFRAWVRDDNLEQSLKFRWYLDFDPDTTTTTTCGCIFSSQALSLGDGRHRTEYPLLHSTTSLTAPSCHRLTVVITDGEWAEDPDECGCPYVVEGSNRTFVDWWLGVHNDDVLVDEVSFGECLILSTRNPLVELEPELEQ